MAFFIPETETMKQAHKHFILQSEEGETSTGGGSVAPASSERVEEFGTVKDAVAELERREAERKAEGKSRRAAAEAKAKAEEAKGTEAVGEDKPKQTKQEASDEADDAEDDGDDSDAEDADEEEDSKADRKPRKEATDTEEGEDEADDAPSLVEIEHEGKKHRIPAELKDAILRQSDYTRKTQEVAQERQVVQAAWQQAQQTIEQANRAQQALIQFAQANLGQPPGLELAQADPQAYLVQRGLYEQRVAQLQQVVEQGHGLTRHQQQLQQQQQAQFLERQNQALLAAMPELKDATKRTAFRTQAIDVGAKYGFTADEIGAIQDHRMLLVMRDLSRAQQQANTRDKATENVRQKLANVPPKVAKTKAGESQSTARNEEAKRQFMKSPRSMRDVEKYLKNLG